MLITSRRVLVTIVALIVLGLAAVAYRTRRVAHVASQFLHQAQNMPTDKISEKQVRDLWQQYRRYGGLERCTNKHCELELHFSNAWLSTLKLAPFTELYGVFVIDNGTLSAKRVGMLTQEDMVDVWENPPTADPFRVFAGTPHKLQIVLTSEATQKERIDAYDLDTGCLIRFGGCKNTEQMNPAVSKYNSSGAFILN